MSEPGVLRALRVVAVAEGFSFVVLIVSSILKRTTGPDIVPFTGSLHGALFVAAVLLTLVNLKRLRWSLWFTAVMLTFGSPGLHFPVAATHPTARPTARH